MLTMVPSLFRSGEGGGLRILGFRVLVKRLKQSVVFFVGITYLKP